MNAIVHENYFVCAGSADAKMPLNAFDHALLDAGIGVGHFCNELKVSRTTLFSA